MEVGQQYFDEFTNRFVNAQGVSGFTNRQNRAKRTLDVINIDASDAPVDSIDGYAIERSYFDDFDIFLEVDDLWLNVTHGAVGDAACEFALSTLVLSLEVVPIGLDGAFFLWEANA